MRTTVVTVHVTVADLGFGLGGPRNFSCLPTNRTNEVTSCTPGCRARLRALEALEYDIAKYAFSLFLVPFSAHLHIFLQTICTFT